MKVKNLVWIIILIIGGAAAAYIGTDEVDISDYWVLGVFTVFGIWWFTRWLKKDTENSSSFIKQINEKIWFLIACLAIPLSLFSQSTEVATDIQGLNTGILFLSGVFGIVIHVMSKIMNLVTSGISKWSDLKAKVNWVKHVRYSLFAIAVLGFVIIAKDSVDSIYPLNYFTVGILGYMADSIFKNWTKYKEIK